MWDGGSTDDDSSEDIGDGVRPTLTSPILVLAFEGWNDAGEAASTASRHLADTFDATPFASIDPEPYYDFTSTRPFVRLDDVEGRVIDWPENTFSAIKTNDDEPDLIVFSGTEPQLRWRTFTKQIAELAVSFDVQLVVTLGSLIADVAHSRPTTIYGTSGDVQLCERLSLEPSRYEGPTGIVGVLHDACQQAGLDTVSLWASVPSYVANAPSPKAALALIDRLGSLIELPILGRHLVEETAEYESQINEALEDDETTREYVTSLEEQYDEELRADSGAGLIEDLEQFLRDQN